MLKLNYMEFETKAIRLQLKKTEHQEHASPIFMTSSFTFENVEEMQEAFSGTKKSNIYSRFTNPSVKEFEDKIACLENTDAAIATSTGMAAVFASFIALLKNGDHIVSSKAVFGSSYQVLNETIADLGISCTFVNALNLNEVQSAIQDNTKMFFLETPSNPALEVFDIEKLGELCKKHQLIYCVDNCFATPYLQKPAQYNADVIVHSATKYIDGQGRVMGGVVAGKQEFIDKIYTYIRRTGASLSPFNAWVLSKSLETLAVRMDRHCSNAFELVTKLENEKSIKKVNYPFLDSHPQSALAKKQMKHGGAIFTFELKGGLEAGISFLNKLRMISLTANLGDTRTIASHPTSTTHLKMPKELKLQNGISDGLIRISVGLENSKDIYNDIKQALS